MPRARLVFSNLRFFWRTNLATGLGVAVAAATLTGALLVGDSMRGSLRKLALARLGRVQAAILPPRFIPEHTPEVASALGTESPAQPGDAPDVPLILLRGGVTHAESGARAEHAQIIGADARFAAAIEGAAFTEPRGQGVVLNAALARELGAAVGDDVLIRVGKPSDISRETLMGRRDDTTTTLRLTVTALAPPACGEFSLNAAAQPPRTAFVALATLQRALNQAGRVNAILLTAQRSHERRNITLADAGLALRVSPELGYVALESDSILIDPAAERAARAAAADLGIPCAGLYVYLANRIEVFGHESGAPDTSPSHSIPYSTVAGVERVTALRQPDGAPAPLPSAGEVLLNEWAARELHAVPGQRVRMTFFVTGAFGQLSERSADFTLAGVVRLAHEAADPRLAPEYPGVTDSDSISDWDPPFPIDLNAIRDQDEAYWDDHRATPKAFVQLTQAQNLWAEEPEQLGRLTSIRFYPTPADAGAARARIEGALAAHLTPAAIGLAPQPLRERALRASGGSTDFGALFIGFSFFLIASSAMLVALLFRLGVERRASQLGVLLACGHTPARVTRLLCAEGLIVAACGAALGMPAAVGYAWAMLAALRTWWSAAMTAPALTLHAQAASFAIGYLASLLLGVFSIWLAVRGLSKLPPSALLAGGALSAQTARSKRGMTLAAALAAVGTIAAAALVVCGVAGVIPQVAGFFGGGAALLSAALAWLRTWLARASWRAVTRPGPGALLRMGVRNARRNPGRSLLTSGLIASATFLITALSAMRIETPGESGGRATGTGGFALLAESAAPVLFDLNTAAGRESLGLSDSAAAALDGVRVLALRLRPGDEASCLNLYQPSEPRILGAPPDFVARGGFEFAGVVAPAAPAGGTGANEAPAGADADSNPWLVLDHAFADGAIPAIGDEAAVVWQLKSGLGREISVRDETGRPVRLRFAALLRGSVLQNELIISERNFARLYPSLTGYQFFMIDTPGAKAGALRTLLERELAPYALDVTVTTDRLRAFAAVQNTYLSAFQTLGGLGLVLGTAGLGAVLLRGVWERRGELALLRALGFSRAALALMVTAENLLLVGLGLLTGLVPALLALAPQLAARAGGVPWLNLSLTWLAVFVTAGLAGALALRSALRTPLLPALRSE